MPEDQPRNPAGYGAVMCVEFHGSMLWSSHGYWPPQDRQRSLLNSRVSLAQ